MVGERFIMYSQIQGEFGPVYFKASAPITPQPFDEEDKNPTPYCFLTCWCSNDDPEYFSFRLQEVASFLQLFSMFNPQIKKDYGLSSSQEP